MDQHHNSAARHTFAIQCDRLRMKTEGTPDEHTWLALMARAKRISFDELALACNFENFLDEDETLEDYCASDPQSGAYLAEYDDEQVYFLQTAGFEFFFTEDGCRPHLMPINASDLSLEAQRQRDPLATLLLGANDPRRNGAGGWEAEVEPLAPGVRQIQGAEHVRLILETEDGPVAGVAIRDDRIDQLYVHSEHRRQGLATALLSVAEAHFGPLTPDSSQTPDGQAFFAAWDERTPSIGTADPYGP